MINHAITFDGSDLTIAHEVDLVPAKMILGIAYGSGLIAEPQMYRLADFNGNTFADETLVDLSKMREFTAHWLGSCPTA